MMEDNDRIIDMACALGRAIKLDDRYKKLDAAREAVDDDAALQDAIGRFNLARINLNSEMAKKQQDKDKIAEINSEMQRLYAEVTDSAMMKKLEQAKEEINELVTWINAILTAAVNGDDPEDVQKPDACGGECGGCSGCH